MAERIRSHDWASTPLGPKEGWPSSLRLAVRLLLDHSVPMVLAWGPDLLTIHNDAYRVLLGSKPAALGRPFLDVWAEARDTLAPQIAAVLAGKPCRFERARFTLSRGSRPEEAFFDCSWSPMRDEDGTVVGVLNTSVEIAARGPAEDRQADMGRTLRENEERQTFLLRLSDALKSLDDPDAIRAEAVNLMGAHLGVDRAAYVALLHPATDDTMTVASTCTRDAAPWAGPASLADFGAVLGPGFAGGTTAVIDDVETDPRFADARAGCAAMGIRAAAGVPIVKDGRLVAAMGVYSAVPRVWTPREIALIEDVAGRTWEAVERVHAGAALRERESDLARVQRIGEVGGIDIDVAGGMRTRRSPEYLRLHGLPPTAREETHADWLGRLHPDDRAGAERALLEALNGRSTVYDGEYRIVRPCDGAVRWINARGDIERDTEGKAVRLVGAHLDVTRQKELEEALREKEEQHAFLLELSDVLRHNDDALRAQSEAMRILGQHLKVSRAQFLEVEDTGQSVDVLAGYAAGVTPLAGPFNLASFGRGATEAYDAGRTVVVHDTAELPIGSKGRQSHDSQDTRAAVGVPIFEDGRLAAVLAVSQNAPRRWSAADISMIEDTAQRTWVAVQRARAEARLRESEERFRQFANASSGALWIRDAATLFMEYVSPAIETIYGVRRDAFLGDVKRWAAAIVPEDRDGALEHVQRARRGEPAIHEFRIQRPSDKAFRWIRDTNFPLYDREGRVQRIGGIAEDVTEEKLAAEHQAVLLSELQHRVRNIMALIRSITARTGQSAESVEDYARSMAGRLTAFARVQALLTRAANVGVGMAAIVESEIAAQAEHAGQYTISGPDVMLSPKATEVMTLAVHELTTNALKYGALSVPEGHVGASWQVVDKDGMPWLSFDWEERGAPRRRAVPSKSPRIGFGSELIEGQIPYELGGVGRLTVEAGGAQCHLEFPLKSGASILETDAPQSATVFGGALDMAGDADLEGQVVLVVEDDYFLATDTVRALRGVGAEVLGPCPTETAALSELADGSPTAAVIDVNLGAGPSFELAGVLDREGVPFVFITGYDEDLIPSEFAAVPRLQKPVNLRDVVSALARRVAPR